MASSNSRSLSLGNVFNPQSLMNRMFRRVDGVVWDLMNGGRTGVQVSDGVATFGYNPPEVDVKEIEGTVTINPLDSFSVSLPAFAQHVPLAQVQLGDLIHGSKDVLGWVVKTNERSFSLMHTDGRISQWVPTKVNMINEVPGAMVVRSLMSMGGGEAGFGSLQSALMPMVMMGAFSGEEGDDQLSKLMPILLMTQSMGGNGANSGSNMMQTMLMMQMLGGKGGNGFF